MSAAHRTTATTTSADTASVTTNNKNDMSKNTTSLEARIAKLEEGHAPLANELDQIRALAHQTRTNSRGNTGILNRIERKLDDSIAKLERQVELNTSAINVLRASDMLLECMDRDKSYTPQFGDVVEYDDEEYRVVSDEPDKDGYWLVVRNLGYTVLYNWVRPKFLTFIRRP